MRVLIVMPTYNERENIPEMLAAIGETLPEAHVLVIDDGSPDGTGAIVDGIAATDPRVHVVHREGKLGLGTAYRLGFAWALERGYERIFEMDADFSHDPADLPRLVAALDEADMVVGSRYVDGGRTVDWGWIRWLISRGGALYARTVLGIDVRDVTSGFVGYRDSTLQNIDLESVRSVGYGFQVEMKFQIRSRGMQIRELPVVFKDRDRGVSKMSWHIVVEAAALVVRLSWRAGFGR